MAHARRTLPEKYSLLDRMREIRGSIELPLLDSSLPPRIALAQVAVKLNAEREQHFDVRCSVRTTRQVDTPVCSKELSPTLNTRRLLRLL